MGEKEEVEDEEVIDVINEVTNEYVEETKDQIDDGQDEPTQEEFEEGIKQSEKYSEQEIRRNTVINKTVNENPDSITYGAPGKLGAIKVYFDTNNKKQAEKKIVNALNLRKYMSDQETIVEAGETK